MPPDGPNLHDRRALVFPADLVPDICPECGGALVEERATLILAGPPAESSLSGASFLFCGGCPVVALDAGSCRDAAGLAGLDPRRFAVAGFVDWEAVPEDKRDVPFGEDDNPIPLVPFSSVEWLGESSPAFRAEFEEVAGPGRQLAGRKGPSWNAPCPCGSNLKYKKCCGGAEHDEWTGKSGRDSWLRPGALSR